MNNNCNNKRKIIELSDNDNLSAETKQVRKRRVIQLSPRSLNNTLDNKNHVDNDTSNNEVNSNSSSNNEIQANNKNSECNDKKSEYNDETESEDDEKSKQNDLSNKPIKTKNKSRKRSKNKSKHEVQSESKSETKIEINIDDNSSDSDSNDNKAEDELLLSIRDSCNSMIDFSYTDENNARILFYIPVNKITGIYCHKRININGIMPECNYCCTVKTDDYRHKSDMSLERFKRILNKINEYHNKN